MSLSYQGNLRRKTFKNPSAAFRFGEGQFAETTHTRRIDLRFAWDRAETLNVVAEHLPSDFKGYWFDVAAEASPTAVAEYAEWIESGDGSRVGVVSLGPNRGHELTIEVPGPSHQRLDHERLDLHRPHLRGNVIRMRYREHLPLGSNSPKQTALAMARIRAVYGEIAQFIDGDLTDFDEWLGATLPKAPLPAAEAGPVRRSEWFTGPMAVPSAVPADAVVLRTLMNGSTLIGLQLTLPADHRDVGLALWRRWLTVLDQIDVVLLRQIGSREEIGKTLNRLDISQQHLEQPYQLFGITTVHETQGLPVELIDKMVNAPRLTERLADWDVRWSDLRVRLDGELDRPDTPSSSHYVVRTEGDRTADRLLLSLDVDDPHDLAFRAARRQLKSIFGPEIGQDSAWQFDGVPITSERGRGFQQLREAILAELDALAGDLAPLPPPVGTPLNRMTDWAAALLRRNRNRERSVVEAFGEAIAERLPGFRYDRRAHITDEYYLEFVRRTAGGFHYIQIERSHRPARHRISVGASAIYVPLSDLTPGDGFTVPGVSVPLEQLLPDHPGEWTYASRGATARAVSDTAAVLEARAEPFFQRAEAHMVAARQSDHDEETR